MSYNNCLNIYQQFLMLLQVLEIDKYTEIDSGRICFSVFVSLEYDNLQFRYRCILHVRPTLYRAPGFC